MYEAKSTFKTMNCKAKARLTMEYEAATTKFSQAVTELRHKIGTTSREEYERLSRAANDERLKSEQARLALEQHTAEHCCQFQRS
jgi:hypothetical protein